MISEEKLFGNFLNDIAIINGRLYGFGMDCKNRLTAANGGGDYTGLIGLITTPLTALGTELGQVDTALNQQIGKTLTNDQVMAGFKLIMSQKKGVLPICSVEFLHRHSSNFTLMAERNIVKQLKKRCLF
jgi:hypothetical protein